jgi:hypothetical protein
MNQQDQQRQETLLDLFNHDGWDILMTELEESTQFLKDNAHLNCHTNDDWQKHKGYLSANEGLLSFEGMTKAVAEQAIEQEESGLYDDL